MILLLSYRGLSGHIYNLNNDLGNGGEGIVYDILNDSRQVAKIYKSSHFKSKNERDTTERKLKAMLAMNLSGYVDNKLLFTWPQDILYDNGMMVGFIMPKINSSLKIYSIYRMGSDVKKIYPKFTWKYSVQFAYNLAWVVQYLHRNGIVVGDFNQNNICVDTKSSAVILIDCDSFDITDPNTGEHFPCTVGFSEVLAPELQTIGNLRYGNFTKESDNFSLAIHIFRLLMKNADPFGGIIASGLSTSSIRQNQAIVNGECQYVRNVGKIIPEWSPELNAMPPEVQSLFDKTFNYTATTAIQRRGRRATAKEWCDALFPYAKGGFNKKLKKCTHNKLHVYSSHNRKCPWCVCEGHDYDPDIERIEHIFQSMTIIMRWLIGLSVLGEFVYLCHMMGDHQIFKDTFVYNLLMIKNNLLNDNFYFGFGLLKDKFIWLGVNFKKLVPGFSSIISMKNLWNNNRLIIHHFTEQLLNVIIMTPVFIDRIKALFNTALNNIILYLGMAFNRMKGLLR